MVLAFNIPLTKGANLWPYQHMPTNNGLGGGWVGWPWVVLRAAAGAPPDVGGQTVSQGWVRDGEWKNN